MFTLDPFLSATSDNGLIQMKMYFWFIAGTLTGLCAAVIALPLFRGALGALERRRVRVTITAAGVIVFVGTAFILYQQIGRPELLESRVVAAPRAHPDVDGEASTDAAVSMQESVARLEARLANDGGKREDWLLLAQSYDFMGRAEDAGRARQMAETGGKLDWQTAATPAASAPLPAASAEAVAEYERRVRAKPGDEEAWRMLATSYRRVHDYAKARDALARLVKLAPDDANAWADYADTMASASGGSLRGAPAKAIDAALRLDPQHPKALWLKASLAHEEHRYADAVRAWQQLQAALPADSPDARIVAANIAEAATLAGQAAGGSAEVPAGVEVSGTVALDTRLAGKVPAGAILFIYAKAADSPGPPLAVLRQAAGSWPVTFRLDDTLAMIPSRKLSQFERVIVEARISRSGQATPTTGDLYVTSAVLNPTERKRIALVINREVG